MAKTFYIVDGHSQIYRAYYAPFRNLTSPSGESVKATFVYTRMLLKLIRDEKPDYLVVALDCPRHRTWRRKLDPEYKLNRQLSPEDLAPQVRRCKQLMDALGVATLEADGYEADDVIATVVRNLRGLNFDVVVVTRDKDLMQLVQDCGRPRVRLYDPSIDATVYAAGVKARWGVRPNQLRELFTLIGDHGDNVPGCPGIGEKTGAKLIGQYGSAHEAVFQAASNPTPKNKRLRIYARSGQMDKTRKLITLGTGVPLGGHFPSSCIAWLPDFAKARPIFRALGFKRWVGLDDVD